MVSESLDSVTGVRDEVGGQGQELPRDPPGPSRLP